MAQPIPFPALLPDPARMDREALLACLRETREQLDWLDDREPEDMDSEAYQLWGDRHEELEDLADEIMDRLEELEER